MNWLKFWAELREPLTHIPLLEESGPWVFLVAVVLLCELLADHVVGPKLIAGGHERAASVLARDMNGLRSGVIVAAFSGLTTLEKEAAILALIAGAVTVALRHWKSIRAYMVEQLMGPFVVVVCFIMGGCGGSLEDAPNRPKMTKGELTCAALNEAKFSPRLAGCKTESCIDEVTREHNEADDACIDEN